MILIHGILRFELLYPILKFSRKKLPLIKNLILDLKNLAQSPKVLEGFFLGGGVVLQNIFTYSYLYWWVQKEVNARWSLSYNMHIIWPTGANHGGGTNRDLFVNRTGADTGHTEYLLYLCQQRGIYVVLVFSKKGYCIEKSTYIWTGRYRSTSGIPTIFNRRILINRRILCSLFTKLMKVNKNFILVRSPGASQRRGPSEKTEKVFRGGKGDFYS